MTRTNPRLPPPRTRGERDDDDDDRMSISSATTLGLNDPVMTIHRLRNYEGALIRIEPPTSPEDSSIAHVPCDIVLVIDVSGSMGNKAPPPTGENGDLQEDPGFSILDLTKHAAFTIVATLNEGDRLGLVTFSTSAEVKLQLVDMTDANKKKVTRQIKEMEPDGSTNLKEGILKGLDLFKGNSNTGRVPALMVLTDGEPSRNQLPSRGFVQMIQREKTVHSGGTLPATIHTFGFGYYLDSGILKSIAEAGGGNYCFIPDGGMIATVFVHAIAHLLTTYATECVVEITTPPSMILKPIAGQCITEKIDEGLNRKRLTVHLGNLQYGQSRDIYLDAAAPSDGENDPTISARLEWSRMQEARYTTTLTSEDLPGHGDYLSDNVEAYHKSRWMLCNFLSSFFLTRDNGEYAFHLNPTSTFNYAMTAFKELLSNIPAQKYDDEYNLSIMKDLTGNSPQGQVSIALSNADYFKSWGRHYFPSLWNAHEKQLCNSFKDPGPMMYNKNDLFIKYIEELDGIFNKTSPPEPSRAGWSASTITRSRGGTDILRQATVIDMSIFNNRGGGCFVGESLVELSNGMHIPIRELKNSMRVKTCHGHRRIAAVLSMSIQPPGDDQNDPNNHNMCAIGKLVVSPWHPIRRDTDGKWVFPKDVGEGVCFTGDIYSLLLERHPDADAHSVRIGGAWGVTLGHGLTGESDDVRAHDFFGSYQRVVDELPEKGHDGVVRLHGLKRDSSGLVCGFEAKAT